MRTTSGPRPSPAGGLERLGPEGMAEVLALAAAAGIRAATDLALRRDPGLVRLLSTTGRADWRFHLPPHARGRVVVVGSGLGGMAFDLSEDYEEVVSCESSADALAWQRFRAAEDGVRNVRIIETPSDAVPLPDGSAELVALDRGVESRRERADDIRPVLAEARRLLASGGWLYWGFANRFGELLVKRPRVRQSGPLLRLGPRRALRLVRSEGFGSIALYWVNPSREEQVTSAPLDDPRMLLEFLRTRRREGIFDGARSLGERWIARTGLSRVVVPDLFLLAQRREPPRGEASRREDE